jgi:hypothetical protein
MLVGEISLSGIKLNQLMLAPQSTGFLSLSQDSVMVSLLFAVLSSEFDLLSLYVILFID